MSLAVNRHGRKGDFFGSHAQRDRCDELIIYPGPQYVQQHGEQVEGIFTWDQLNTAIKTYDIFLYCSDTLSELHSKHYNVN